MFNLINLMYNKILIYCMDMNEFKKTIDIILNPTTVFVSQGAKTVVAIPVANDKKSTDN